MSEHKYNDAYSKGFEAGKKQAFTGYCMQCYDELSPYEQAKLMVECGADIPDVLDKIRAEVTSIAINGTVDEHTMFIRTGDQVKQMVLNIIDKYKAEGSEE